MRGRKRHLGARGEGRIDGERVGGRQHREGNHRSGSPHQHHRVRAEAKVHGVLGARAREDQEAQHKPRPRMTIEAREMVGEHREEHGQRHVMVVRGALLGPITIGGVDRAAFFRRGQHVLLGRDNPKEDVGCHDGAHHRAYLKEGRARAEIAQNAVSCAEQQEEAHDPKHPTITNQRCATEQVVHNHGAHEEANAEIDRRAIRKGRVGVDQHGPAAQIIDDARGVDEEERKRLHALIKKAESTPVVVPVDDTAKAAADKKHLGALIALRVWYEEWSEMARAAVKRRDHLILLGLAKRKSPKGKKGLAAPPA